MSQERPIKHRLLSEVAVAISDGMAVDWNDIGDAAIDERERQLLELLKVVSQVAMPVWSSPSEVPEDLAASDIPGGLVEEFQDVSESRLDEVDVVEPEPPTRWAHLEIRAKVSRGAFGEVYLAWDTKLGREVALKLLHADRAAANATTLGSFVLEEGHHLARVRNPNVITVYGADTDQGRVGLWMEYIVGRTLEDHLVVHGRLGARHASLIGIDLCRALGAVHAAGLVHRDIKTRNVMIEDGGRTVLMDFGAGQEMRPDSASKVSTITGTPYYMAPEVMKGAPPSRQSDIYSLGVLLYRLVTREYPVEGTSVQELLDVHEQRAARILRDARPDLPEAFITVVERALAFEPRDRFASAGKMAQALVESVDPHPLALAMARLKKQLSWRLLASSALGVVLAVGLGWVLLGDRWPRSQVAVAPTTWRTDGVPACAAPGKQSVTSLVADGLGGAIVVWQDARNGGSDIYAQRFDALGASQWAPNGIPVCNSNGDQRFVDSWYTGDNAGPPATTCVPDGQGGAIMTWCDMRSAQHDIYVQRITSSGAVASGWPPNGLPVCTRGAQQDTPTLATDGAGGAVVAWEDRREASFDIFAQRIDASGRPLWEKDGIVVCQILVSDERDPSVVDDGAGGAIICWRESPDDKLRAQRVDATGRTLWRDGVTICAAAGEKSRAIPISDGSGGALFTWEDRRSGEYDIYAQRVTASGHIAPGWSQDGIGICVYSFHDQRDPVLVADGEGGAIIVWYDWRSFCNPGRHNCASIYAQRVGAAGDIHWQKTGVLICSILGDETNSHAVSDGAGGAIVAWSDYRSASPPYSTTSGSGDVYAQRIDGSGIVRWRADGVAISTAAGAQIIPFLDSDGAGGAIITWPDGRDANDDIYVNRITAAGVAAAATPILTVPADIRVTTEPGACTAKVEFDVVARGLPEPTVACSARSGRDFPPGNTTVQCTATSSSGTVTRSFVVTVVENRPPKLEAPAAVTADREPGIPGRRSANLALGRPRTYGACGGLVFTNDAPEIFAVGTTQVTWTATDTSGKKVVATQSVTIREISNR